MQPATTLSQLNTVPQSIVFSESEGACTAEVVSSSVVVSTDAGDHNHGSSKVKLKNLVDYSWEHRYYTGQLLAVHMGGKYLAYAMKEANKPMESIIQEMMRTATSELKPKGISEKAYSLAELVEHSKSLLCQELPAGLEHFPEELVKKDVPDKPNPSSWSGMVRVIHRTTDKRVLLKGMKGEVQDLSFAFIENQIVLASIDALGHTYVHNIELVDDVLRGTLVAEVLNDAGAVGMRHRVVWCPYIPDDDDAGSEPEEDTARLLLTTHYNTARIWKMWGVVGSLTAGTTAVTTSSLLESNSPNLMSVSEHAAAIVDAAFSPDGTALATASIDGYVMFFQVYMHNDTSPRCLHRWQPHEGKSLSCLFFLDNHKNYNSDVQFWKFAVTGAERCSVLKIWCCKSWDCLQTITFTSDIGPELGPDINFGFKAVLEAGAQYFLLSDFKRRCLCVLHMAQDNNDLVAYCKSISEFLLPFPVLNLLTMDCDTGFKAVLEAGAQYFLLSDFKRRCLYVLHMAQDNNDLVAYCKSISEFLLPFPVLNLLTMDCDTGFKAVLEAGAQYLLLSDFKRRCLYVLHMAQDNNDLVAYCKSISEFLLPFPVLNLLTMDCDTGFKAVLEAGAQYFLLSDFKRRCLYVLHMAQDNNDLVAYCKSISEFLLPFPVLNLLTMDCDTGFKAVLEAGAQYFLLSDFKRRCLYVLHMAQDNNDLVAYCKSISEFLLPFPVLNLLTMDCDTGFKAVLEAGAQYLLLSDFKRRCLYVLHMAQDNNDLVAYCKSISEFLLPFPVLNLLTMDCDTGFKAVLEAGAQYLLLSNFKRRCLYVLHMAQDNNDLVAYCKSISEFLLPFPVLNLLTMDCDTGFKAVLEAGAQYLLLSDFKRRCLYVLHMAQDNNDLVAYCKSISEFLLPFPVLSFAVADAGTHSMKCTSSCGDPYHTNGANGEDGVSPATFDHAHELEDVESSCLNGEGGGDGEGCGARALIKLYLLQPKGLQEGRLLFTPPQRNNLAPQSPELGDLTLEAESLEAESPEPGTEASEPLNSILQQQSQQLKNLLMRAQTQPGSLMGQRAESPPCAPPPPPQLNLMTPDAFSSPGKRDEEDPPISATPEIINEPLVLGHTLANPSPPAYELEEAPPKYASVGSSPSREVQEILSLKESEYFKEALAEATPELAADALPNGSAPYEADMFPAGPSPPLQSNVTAAKETVWPQITIAQINEANQRKASSDKSTSHSMNNSLVNATELSNAAELSTDGGSEEARAARRAELWAPERARLDALEDKLEKMTDMLGEQSLLLRALAEGAAAAGEGAAAAREGAGAAAAETRETIGHALHAHTTQTALAIDQAFDERWGRVEMAAASAGAAAGDAASAAVGRALEPFLRSLHAEFATRVSATDKLLRDNIEKMVLSKSIQESLGNAVARTLAGMVRDSFREVMGQTLVPAIEKATAQIFKQVNHAFQNGTREFAANTEAYARAAAERGGAAAAESLRAALQRHADALTALASQPPPPPPPAPPALQQLTPVLHSAVRGVLEHEMSRWREQAASVLEMSRSQTPMTPRVSHTPHQIVDRQVQVSQVSSLLSAGDVNGAFQVALSASDLSLVVHACRAADPARVFTPRCLLKQHVLLSLVQQLAADMTSDTQLKHRYLEEAIINLDPSNPVTREHMPVVVRELKKQLSSFLAANPTHQLARPIKMLQMATESLLNSSSAATVAANNL